MSNSENPKSQKTQPTQEDFWREPKGVPASQSRGPRALMSLPPIVPVKSRMKPPARNCHVPLTRQMLLRPSPPSRTLHPPKLTLLYEAQRSTGAGVSFFGPTPHGGVPPSQFPHHTTNATLIRSRDHTTALMTHWCTLAPRLSRTPLP